MQCNAAQCDISNTIVLSCLLKCNNQFSDTNYIEKERKFRSHVFSQRKSKRALLPPVVNTRWHCYRLTSSQTDRGQINKTLKKPRRIHQLTIYNSNKPNPKRLRAYFSVLKRYPLCELHSRSNKTGHRKKSTRFVKGKFTFVLYCIILRCFSVCVYWEFINGIAFVLVSV